MFALHHSHGGCPILAFFARVGIDAAGAMGIPYAAMDRDLFSGSCSVGCAAAGLCGTRPCTKHKDGAPGTTTFEVSLNSGRPHQIRIHLASIGHPLVGDPLYGVSGQPLENLPGLPGDGGYFLHARFLKFHHPITGKPINLEAALPSGFSLDQ